MKNFQKILPNIYRDSVALMKISSKLCDLPGISKASVIMATKANIELLNEVGLLEENISPQPNNLLVAIQGNDEEIIGVAFKQVEKSINEAGAQALSDGEQTLTPQSIEMALDEFPEAQLALISCPGEYAESEAQKALNLGLDVMIFSDNVSIEGELALKKYATNSDQLVMGPDCGTAILNGVPLGFANVVRPGNIGIVAASGTGLQQISSLVDQLGGGVSQAIGTGGRDLHAKIGGLSMLKGIQILARDDATEIITLVSKPPSPEIADKVLNEARKCGKLVVVSFLGADLAAITGDNLFPVETLEQAAHTAFLLSQGRKPTDDLLPRHTIENSIIQEVVSSFSDTQRYVRGLYSGGTFSYEAMLLLGLDVGPMNSAVPLSGEHKLNDIWSSTGNTVIDLGDDLFTRGRPHPMIDCRLRNDRILQEAKDPETAVILLDVVIGHGSHHDPAGELVGSIQDAKAAAQQLGNRLAFVTFVCGTKSDPQNLVEQEKKLRDVGAIVLGSNAQAVRLASDVIKAIGNS
jgi:FdrA protein